MPDAEEMIPLFMNLFNDPFTAVVSPGPVSTDTI